VNDVKAVAELPGTYALLEGFGFRGGSIFICPTDVQRFVAAGPAKTGKDVGGEDLNEVSQMGNVVNVG
jgi:hypothetical protein